MSPEDEEMVQQVVVVCRDCGRVDAETRESLQGRKVLHPVLCQSCRGDRRVASDAIVEGKVGVVESESLDTEEKPVVAFVSNRFYNSRTNVTHGKKDEEEIPSVHLFQGPVAFVGRKYGLTINLGDYEAARIDVSISVPCYLADVDAADAWATAWVERRIVGEVQQVRESVSKQIQKAPKKEPRF